MTTRSEDETNSHRPEAGSMRPASGKPSPDAASAPAAPQAAQGGSSGGTRSGAKASADVARRRMSIGQLSDAALPGFRRVPNAGEMARRRRLLRWTKWTLPAGALLLLASIAAWPEIDRSMNAARVALHDVARLRADGGRMIGASYRGLDSHGRPYMITAEDAQQVGGDGGTANLSAPDDATDSGGPPAPKQKSTDDRIDLDRPVADTLSQGGNWIRISGDDGVYLQQKQQLDLSRHVSLYRDDGIMMTGPTADLDLRRGVIASRDWIHAEGPFGVLDAQSYLMSQRDGLAQFRGPARLVLNDDRIARPATTAPAGTPR